MMAMCCCAVCGFPRIFVVCFYIRRNIIMFREEPEPALPLSYIGAHLFSSLMGFGDRQIARIRGMVEYSSRPPTAAASHRVGRNRSKYYMPSLLAALLPFLPLSASFEPSSHNALSVPRHSHRGYAMVASPDDGNGMDDECDRRHHRDRKRFIIASAFAVAPYFGCWSWDPRAGPITTTTVMSMSSSPPAAYALQERNEALCNTGFFTNVGAWYCTDIGNIGDEGKSKALSDEAEARVDSLMSKFDLDDGDIGGGTTKGENGRANVKGIHENGDTAKVGTGSTSF